MSRYWSEKRLPYNAPVKDVNSAIGSVLAKKAYFVEVCSFKFEFQTLGQLEETLAYFSRKTHPSSRLPDRQWIAAEARKNPKHYRENIRCLMRAERFEIQRWYEKLPMWLYEEPKRKKIVKILGQALEEFSTETE